MQITVDVDKLRSSSSSIKTINNDIETHMGSIELLVESLSGSWQGDAEKAYASRLAYVRREFLELNRFFDEYSALLSSFADDYTRYEDELASKIMEV